jgi:glycosyltransferase involved in cell wall biosynthesis
MLTDNCISVVIITLNEEKNIGRCIDSVKGVADEIIVVDSGSADDTRNIASQKGAVIVEKEWIGFSATKNFANSLAKHNYVLSLDADEALSEELRTSIINLKQNGFDGVYEFNRLTNYCGKWIYHCGWYPDKKIRLFPKNTAEWQGEYVHEKLVLPDNVKLSFLKGDLLHYSYYSEQEHIDRLKKYALLGSERIRNEKKKGLYFLAISNSFFRWVKMFILKRGFMDGYYGWLICKNSALEVFYKYWWAANRKPASV